MGGRLFLPDVMWPPPNPATGGLASRETLERAAPDVARQQTLSPVPAGTPARIVLGRGRVGGDLWVALPHSGYWVMQCIWCWAPGGIDAIESVAWNDEATWPAGTTVTHYTGAPGQGVDPTLAAAFAAAGKTYADTLPDVAYSVVKAPIAVVGTGGLPNLVAVIRGLKAYDPRTGLTTWTQCASLLMAAYLTATAWGPGYTLNWAASTPAFDANDAQVAGRPRRTLNLVLDRPAPTARRIEELRSYAGCFLENGPAGVELIPDRPKASVGSLDHSAGQIQRFGRVKKRPQSQKPTLVRIRWTDTSRTPWDANAIAEFPAGGSEERVSEIPMPGIHDYSEALRYAAETYYRLTLGDLSFDLECFDEAAAWRVGDVLDVSLPWGVVAKPMQVFSRAITDLGRVALSFNEYDPGFFSDAIGTAPSHADTAFADPNKPSAPSALTLSEELFTAQGDKTSSRIKAVIAAPADFPWTDHYRVNVIAAGEVVWTDTVRPGDVFRSGTLAEKVLYQVDVYTVSRSGAASSPLSKTITAQGKLLPPTDVIVFTGFESGGEVFLTVGAVMDIDLIGLEVRYGLTGVTWVGAKFVDFKAAASGVGAVVRSNIVPEGTWDFLACGRDSGGRYSTTPKRLTLTVTKDNAAFLVDNHLFDGTPTLTLMSEARLRRGGPVHWITDAGDDMNYGHADPDPATGDYADLADQPFSAPRSGGTAIWESTVWDVGVLVSGNWAITADIAIHSGTVDVILSLSETGGVGTWTDLVGAAQKATGRFAMVRLEGAGVWQLNGAPEVRIDAVPRIESGTVTCSASAPVTVTLAGKAAFVKSIKLTLVGQPPGSALYDNVQIAPDGTVTFELERFDSNDVRLGAVLLDWEARYV